MFLTPDWSYFVDFQRRAAGSIAPPERGKKFGASRPVHAIRVTFKSLEQRLV